MIDNSHPDFRKWARLAHQGGICLIVEGEEMYALQSSDRPPQLTAHDMGHKYALSNASDVKIIPVSESVSSNSRSFLSYFSRLFS